VVFCRFLQLLHLLQIGALEGIVRVPISGHFVTLYRGCGRRGRA
jgi:hypothetical protein